MFTTLHTPYDISGAGLPIAWQFQAAANWDTFDSYYLRLRVQTETPYRTYVWSNFVILEQEPAPDGTITFNFSHFLKSKVESDPPDWINQSQARVCERMNALHRIYIDEVTNGAVTYQINYGLFSPLHVLHGSFPWKTGQDYATYKTGGKFLTYQPRVKKVTDCQPEWLRMIITTNNTTANVKAEVTFENGNTQAVNPAISVLGQNNDVIEIPSGFMQLGLDSISGNIASWKVWVEDQSQNVISEEMTYQLDFLGFSDITRYYLFENQLGGFDTLRTTGVLEVKEKIQRDEYSLIPSPIGFEGTKTQIQFGVKSGKEYKQNSGWMTHSEQSWALGITKSTDVYLVGDDHLPNLDASGDLTPVNITSSSTDIHQDHEFLKSIVFTAEMAFSEIYL